MHYVEEIIGYFTKTHVARLTFLFHEELKANFIHRDPGSEHVSTVKTETPAQETYDVHYTG